MTPPVAITPALLRLLTWLSPSFPVGAYSYSNGLEYAVDDGLVRDTPSLAAWITAILERGSARNDAILFRIAHDAVTADDHDDLAWVIERAAIMRGTAETALEATQQGQSFMTAVTAVWPHPMLDRVSALARKHDRPVAYPVAVATAAAAATVPLRPALAAYLQAWVANLVSAGVRLVPLGQTDGLRAIAALEQPVLDATDAALTAQREDLGTATPLVDWASMRHETMYTRLFRS